MKKCKISLLVMALVLGLAAPALAIDVKMSGQFIVGFGWRDGTSLVKDVNEDDFRAMQRLRLGAQFIASESLKGVVEFEIGPTFWGRDGSTTTSYGIVPSASNPGLYSPGGQLDTDGINIKTRYAYIDWMAPGLDNKLRIQMGLIPLYLPSTVLPSLAGGNPVFGGDVGGISMAYQFTPEFSLTGFWARPYDAAESIPSGNTFDAMDMFGLVASYNTKALTFQPWLLYSSIGNVTNFWRYRSVGTQGMGQNSIYTDPIKSSLVMSSGPSPATPLTPNTMTGDSDLWSGGFALRAVPFEIPLTFHLDAMYGNLDNSDPNGADFAGWYAAARVEYKLSWGHIGVYGWYASGDDADALKDRDYGRMPAINFDPPWSMMGMGAGDISLPGIPYGFITNSGLGLWGVGFGLREVNLGLTEKMYHTWRITYYEGTNHPDNVRAYRSGAVANASLATMGEAKYMTTEDYAIDVTLANRYEIMPYLNAYLDLGYMYADFDKEVWKNNYTRHDAWKCAVGFKYQF